MDSLIATPQEAANRLQQLGFLERTPMPWEAMTDGCEIVAATKAYQELHGLQVTGEIDPVTYRSMFEPRFCGLPDVLPFVLEATNSRWPTPDITWALINPWSNPTMDIVKQAFEWAWAQWAAVCNIRPRFVESVNQSMVRIETAPIDQPGGTLAWSELAAGNMNPKRQRYDSLEKWVFAAQPQQFFIDLGRVACHEIGHVLGISHIQAGNLLQPSYSTQIRTPQAGDIREAQSRYGPPVSAPPAPPADKKFTLVLEATAADIQRLEASGFKITKA